MKLKTLLEALETGREITLWNASAPGLYPHPATGIVNGLRRESGVGKGDTWLVTLITEGKPNREIFVRVEAAKAPVDADEMWERNDEFSRR